MLTVRRVAVLVCNLPDVPAVDEVVVGDTDERRADVFGQAGCALVAGKPSLECEVDLWARRVALDARGVIRIEAASDIVDHVWGEYCCSVKDDCGIAHHFVEQNVGDLAHDARRGPLRTGDTD